MELVQLTFHSYSFKAVLHAMSVGIFLAVVGVKQGGEVGVFPYKTQYNEEFKPACTFLSQFLFNHLQLRFLYG
jgi:hypothetical protein